MKPAIAFTTLCTCAALLAPACGSHDSKKTGRGQDAGAGGESPVSGGFPGTGGVPNEAGAPNEGGNPQGGEPPQGGNGGEAPVTSGGQGGAAGDGAAAGDGGTGGVGELLPVTCEPATVCSGDLSAIGLGDFSIAFTLATTSKMHSGILSQRTLCGHSPFWDVRLGTLANPAALAIELDDGGASYTNLSAFAPFNDGSAHDVRVCRKSGHVYAFSDGVLLADTANQTSFTTLPALATKTSVCGSQDGTVTLVGTLTNVCVGAL